jgi:hypothetical protein
MIFHCGGINIPSSSADGPPMVGFYTTRIVWARNKASALCTGKASIEAEWLRMGQGELSGTLEAESINQTTIGDGLFGKPRRGFTLYAEG